MKASLINALPIISGIFCAALGSPSQTMANLNLTYKFESPTVSRAGDYDSIVVPGLKQYIKEGYPTIPYKSAAIMLPYRTEFKSIRVSSSQAIEIEGKYALEPGQNLCSAEQPIEPDPNIFSSSVPYPSSRFELVTTQIARGYRVLYLNIFPIMYVPSQGKVFRHAQIDVDIETQPSDEAWGYRGLIKDRLHIERSVDNPETTATYPLVTTAIMRRNLPKGSSPEPSWPPQTEVVPVEYVIITSAGLKYPNTSYNFQTLEAHRENHGLNTTIITIDQITNWYSGTRPDGAIDNQTKIRNFIKDAYGKWSTDYVLLGGHCDIVPIRYFYLPGSSPNLPNVPADIYYGCLDGTFDNSANGQYGEQTDGPAGSEVDLSFEVSVGRFSLGTGSELSNIVRKTIDYEISEMPFLHGAYFSAGTDLSGSSSWMEEMKWGTDSTNGFAKAAYFNSWSDCYIHGTLLGQNLVSAINSNQHSIYNNDSHGLISGYLGMGILTSANPGFQPKLSDLSNDSPFFTIIQDCFSGQFDNQTGNHTPAAYCFCEELTAMNYGAFAAIGMARTGPNKYFANEFWDAIFREGVNAIGDAHNDSKEEFIGQINLYRGTYYWQHLFGDPAAVIRMNRIPTVLGGGDFDGDGDSDISIFRPLSSGYWSIKDVGAAYFGAKTDLPANGDYNGDGTSEIAIFRKTSGYWAIKDLTRFYLGDSSYFPIPGDYSGDGTIDPIVYRPSDSLWAVRCLTSFYFGNHLDIPTFFDSNGDDRDDPAVFEPASGTWKVRGITTVAFGIGGDMPVPADYDGSPGDEIAIFRPTDNLWAIRNLTRCYFGDFNSYYCMPVPADYDGNGVDDIAIFRPTNGYWSARYLTSCFFGSYADFPAAARP